MQSVVGSMVCSHLSFPSRHIIRMMQATDCNQPCEKNCWLNAEHLTLLAQAQTYPNWFPDGSICQCQTPSAFAIAMRNFSRSRTGN